MKYIVNRKHKFKKKYSSLQNPLIISGYLLPSKSKKFHIEGCEISNIIIVSKSMAHPFVKKIAYKKYKKLINNIAELFVSDEDPGTAMSEVLNQIEKFRDETKRKYRKYLRKKELEEMSLKLKFLQKEAKAKQVDLYFLTREKEPHRAK